MWNSGPMTEQETQAFCLGLSWDMVWDLLNQKFKLNKDGRWYNERLEDERLKQIAFREKQAKNGILGGRPKAKQNPDHNPNETQTLTQTQTQTKAKQNPSVSVSESIKEEVLTDSSPEAVDQSEPAAAGSPAPKPPEGEEPYELKPEPATKAKRKREPKPFDPNRATMDDVLDCWEHYWGKKIQLTDARKKSLRARLRNDWWEQNFAEGCRRATKSEFCNGSSPSGWVATFDWFIRPDTLAKIMEGAYEKHKKDPYASFQKFSAASQG
jgi:uncharacterized protein YdaU (DUF1376 family)